MNDDENIEDKYGPEEELQPNIKEPICPRCGLRSYDDVCQSCGTPIVDKKDDEEEDYDWREKHR